LPKQPFIDRNASAFVARIELSGLAAEILQDGAGFENRDRPPAWARRIDNGWNAIVWRDRQNAGANCSPLEMSTGRTTYGSPHSSSMIEIFQPFGVGQ
jgi:hypothetical protein